MVEFCQTLTSFSHILKILAQAALLTGMASNTIIGKLVTQAVAITCHAGGKMKPKRSESCMSWNTGE